MGGKVKAARATTAPYDADIAREICLAVIDGEHPEDVCGKDGVPDWRTIKIWMLKHPDTFGKELEAAQAIGLKNAIIRTQNDLDSVIREGILPGAKDEDGQFEGPLTQTQRDRAISALQGKLRSLASLEGKRIRHEHTGKGGGPIPFTVITTPTGEADAG